jgi:fimbrial chaperone protein
MKRTVKFGSLFLIIALGWPSWVSAYSVSPSLVLLHPAGNESSSFLHLENRAAKPVAIEVTVQEHRKDIDGNTLQGREADDDFVIFPAQLVLLPGDEAGVQMRWVGETKLAAERVYTIVTREVTIPQKGTEEPEAAEGIRVAVNVRLNYEVRVYVAPPGAKAKVVVESVTEKNAGALEVVFWNQGTAHQALFGATLALTPLDPAGAPLPQRTVLLPAKDIPALKPHLLAGDRRRILIPRPSALPAGQIRVTVAE